MDERDPWWHDALCSEVGIDIFFITREESPVPAKRVCEMCPVREECLAESLVADVEYGIFGGFGRDERRRLVLKVQAGQSPRLVAAAAIHREKATRDRSRARARAPRYRATA